jgi:hypothetical protein
VPIRELSCGKQVCFRISHGNERSRIQLENAGSVMPRDYGFTTYQKPLNFPRF